MAWCKSLQFMGKQIFLKQILNNIKQHKWNKISYTNKIKQCEKHQIQLNELITDEHKRDTDASKQYGHHGGRERAVILTDICKSRGDKSALI